MQLEEKIISIYAIWFYITLHVFCLLANLGFSMGSEKYCNDNVMPIFKMNSLLYSING